MLLIHCESVWFRLICAATDTMIAGTGRTVIDGKKACHDVWWLSPPQSASNPADRRRRLSDDIQKPFSGPPSLTSAGPPRVTRSSNPRRGSGVKKKPPVVQLFRNVRLPLTFAPPNCRSPSKFHDVHWLQLIVRCRNQRVTLLLRTWNQWPWRI